MSDSSPRLAALHFLLRVQERDLARTRRWIEDEEQAVAAQDRRRAKEEARRPPAGEWLLDHRRRPPLLHQGYCWELTAGMRPVTRAQALEALTVGGVQPCPGCHPARELGLLD
ncbi:DUF6233 domain-containing protein [Streptomyces sp. 8L]|uniref:DUF6233 domain-containing protein n=1 Tax=Streptomyces sp. 8L TaxID=2877242 RepID=UPI001CD7F5C2|nr:DUF6233 domain-containing protein [Streptomyces sp. 8L]MCA1217074.1 DUF6233 domain-containing protein [Streptomyces sp. 8L]